MLLIFQKFTSVFIYKIVLKKLQISPNSSEQSTVIHIEYMLLWSQLYQQELINKLKTSVTDIVI